MPKILVVRFSSIGDIVLTSPVVRCLKQQVKDAQVHYLTKVAFADVIEHNPYIDKKIFFENDFKELVASLKEEQYDYLIDLHHNLRTLRLKAALGVKAFSFNKVNLEKWLMVNFKINILPKVHIVDRYQETVKSFGVSNDGKGLEYFISQKDGEAIERLPVEFQNGYVAFVIGAKHKTKQLPDEKIHAIIEKIDRPVVLLGDTGDIPKGNRIAEFKIQKPVLSLSKGSKFKVENHNGELRPIYNACGKFSLNESAAILKHAHAVITHDTGLMHIAAAYKKKIISIWGNTIPEFGMAPYYGAFQIPNRIFEIRNLPCRPCSKLGYEKCPKKHFRCMKDIDEAAVAETANSI